MSAGPEPNGPDTVEIITIGDELLLGHTIDTNAAFLSRELVGAGLRVMRRSTVGDDEQAIAEAVSAALDRARFVICTGGLGSTSDDYTRPVIAKLFDAPLELDQRLLDALAERFRLRGITMTPNNRSQAEVPRGATVLPNPRGTAQGLALRRPDDHWCILLPGVPHELRGLTVEQVVPFIRGKGRGKGRGKEGYCIRYRVVRTTGIAESTVAQTLEELLPQLAPLAVAFLPSFAGTDLRITSWGELDDGEAERALEAAEHLIRGALSAHIYGSGSDDLAAVIGQLLRERGLRLSVAESCTGGLLAKRITDIPGSSDYFHGGVVAYANDAKLELLGVSAETLQEHGAVSEAAVREMIRGALRMGMCNAAIAVTGVAGPGGGTPDKPVGTVWIAVAVNDEVQARRVLFQGDREEIRERSAQAALTLLWKLLRSLPLPLPLPLPLM